MDLTINGHKHELQVNNVDYGSVTSTVTYSLCLGALTVRVESITESLKYDVFTRVIVTVKDPTNPRRVWQVRADQGQEQVAFEQARADAERDLGQPFNLDSSPIPALLSDPIQYDEFCEYLDDEMFLPI